MTCITSKPSSPDRSGKIFPTCPTYFRNQGTANVYACKSRLNMWMFPEANLFVGRYRAPLLLKSPHHMPPLLGFIPPNSCLPYSIYLLRPKTRTGCLRFQCFRFQRGGTAPILP